MERSMEIFADIVLSFNGEDIFIKAANESITMTTPSVRSGLRALLDMDEHHGLSKRANEVNRALTVLGWTLYAHIGILKLGLLGLNAQRGFLSALFIFGRLGRSVRFV